MPFMKPIRDVGVAGYGACIPRYRLPATEVSRVWTRGSARAPIGEKAVPGLDEDVITLSIEAVRNALARARIRDPQEIGAVWVGSESHPYAVKPTGTVVAEAIGTGADVLAADWQFACKAGSEAIQGAIGLVGGGLVPYAVGVGMDTAQGRPGDALEYTAGAGGAAFILGPAESSIAVVEGTFSLVSDTPDFWRKPRSAYPSHGGRFTGEPAYFRHVIGAAERLLDALGRHPTDYAHAVFHQPNNKFPARAARQLGFRPEQMKVGSLCQDVGNTYAGAALLGLTAVLDEAEPGDRVLMVAFGSGAGADAISLKVTERVDGRNLAPTTRQYIARRSPLDYAMYARHRKKLAVGE